MGVVENLVSNAIKYGATNTPIDVTLKYGSGKILLSVHNQGNPISALDQQKLFQLFGRTQSALSSGHKGWGIGLVLVRGMVEALSGNIEVSSDEARGTTFNITVPWKNS